MMMGDEVLAETLMRMFVANTPGDIERLRVAVEQGDLAAARAAAHLVKGAAANMCAAELRDVAYDIEMAAQDGNIELADRLVRQLDTRWQDFLRHPKVREGLTAG